MSEPMVVIREYFSDVEAIIARTVLEAHDIEATVVRDDAGGLLPSMRLVFPIKLMVRHAEAVESLRILDSPVEHGDNDSGLDD